MHALPRSKLAEYGPIKERRLGQLQILGESVKADRVLYGQLAREKSTVIRKYEELTASRIVADLDSIEQEFLSKVRGSKRLSLEVQRQIAECKLDLLALKNEPEELVENVYQLNYRLGFASLDRRGTVDIFFAQYCLRIAKPDRARLVLRTLLSRVRQAAASRKRLVYDHLLRDVNGLLARIR